MDCLVGHPEHTKVILVYDILPHIRKLSLVLFAVPCDLGLGELHLLEEEFGVVGSFIQVFCLDSFYLVSLILSYQGDVVFVLLCYERGRGGY